MGPSAVPESRDIVPGVLSDWGILKAWGQAAASLFRQLCHGANLRESLFLFWEISFSIHPHTL